MLRGIDTSKWQNGKVDYAAAKKAGYDFVFLRVGSGSTKDPLFEKDYAAAVAAGLRVGVYFYTYSTNEAGALQDATRVLGWLNNRKLDLPVAFDIEDPKQRDVTRKTLNARMYNAFAAKVKEKYPTILYTYESFFNSFMNGSIIKDPLWIAKYSNTAPKIGRDVHIWQYTSNAQAADFFKDKLDRNQMLIDLWETVKASAPAPKNPYPVPTRTLKKTIPMQKGTDVKWLQYELGMPTKQIDGYFGADTKSAVILYQKQHGLKADGIVGSATRYALLND